MDKELKAKWLDALRSGKYVQGRGALRTESDTYCCLGVLCDVVGEEWKRKPSGAWGVELVGGEFVESGVLTPTVRDKCGLNACNPEVMLPGGVYPEALSELNDSGMSFAEIADLIEEQL